MRPIHKGTVPAVNGIAKTVTDYKDWRADLLDRLGPYCCYCNMDLKDSPQVEHVIPKSTTPELQLEWDNMLLACGPCNRAKSDDDYNTDDHYLPDYHNTLLAFDYLILKHPTKADTNACIVIPAENDVVNTQKSIDTIKLFKLDALKSNKRATDLRWKYRYEAYYAAQVWKKHWDDWGREKHVEFIELMIICAISKGFFGIWFKFFNDVPSVKVALINAFVGTNNYAFDNTLTPISLNEGDL
ncbi:HNH endonuclease [Sphingobacterium sp. UBA1498]|uniref:HNH endonuclease n=1 Tax=Sphingobacterium sp. UBA1498 TaxID=1947481 RepID=UPI0025E302D7|nr:HNH endonuclease [Sphingobacterium sp. UBA1498]